MTRYSISGTEYVSNGLNFQAALEAAYKSRVRPICLCAEPGLPMYIAHLETTYVIKRMPDSGDSHASWLRVLRSASGVVRPWRG